MICARLAAVLPALLTAGAAGALTGDADWRVSVEASATLQPVEGKECTQVAALFSEPLASLFHCKEKGTISSVCGDDLTELAGVKTRRLTIQGWLINFVITVPEENVDEVADTWTQVANASNGDSNDTDSLNSLNTFLDLLNESFAEQNVTLGNVSDITPPVVKIVTNTATSTLSSTSRTSVTTTASTTTDVTMTSVSETEVSATGSTSEGVTTTTATTTTGALVPICNDPCGLWGRRFALEAWCPKGFRLSAGSTAQSIGAWEGGFRTGSPASTCTVRGSGGVLASQAITYNSFALPSAAPRKLRYVAYNTKLYYDSHSSGSLSLGPTLRVWYQVWDEHFVSEVSAWTPSGWSPTITVVIGGSTTAIGTCSSPSAATGVGSCSLNLQSYFSASEDVSATVSLTGDGITEYLGATTQDSSAQGSATLYRNTNINTATNAQTSTQGSVYFVAPTHPLFPSETFEVHVQANTGSLTFKQLDMVTYWDQSSLNLFSAAMPSGTFATNHKILIESYKSGGTENVNSASQCAGACTWQVVLDRETGGAPMSGDLHTLTLGFLLPGSLPTGLQDDVLRATVTFFFYEDAQGNVLTLNPVTDDIPVVGLEGTVGGTLPSQMDVFIESNEQVAVYGSFTGGQLPGTLVNTARLAGGSPNSATVFVNQLSSFQTSAVSASLTGCTSSSSDAFSCTTSGSSAVIRTSQSHTAGAYNAHATVSTSGGAAADIYLHAYYPEMVGVNVSQAVLRNIAEDGQCSGEFEEAEVSVFMRFSTAEGQVLLDPSASVDVTELVVQGGLLQVTSGSSFVELDGSTVEGIPVVTTVTGSFRRLAGTSVIGVSGFPSASASVEVTDTTVQPTTTALTLDETTASASQTYVSHPAGADPTLEDYTTSCTFDQEGSVGYVYVFAEFESGGVVSVPASSITFTSVQPDVMAVVSSNKVEVPVGAYELCGDMIQATYSLQTDGNCTGGNLSATSLIDVSIGGACQVEFTLSSTAIAQEGDFASLYPYNYPTSASITSVLVSFCEPGTDDVVSYTEEMVADSRTRVEIIDAQNLVYNATTGQFTATGVSGSAVVQVSFTSKAVNQTLSVVGHMDGVLPEPCNPQVTLSEAEITQDGGEGAALAPFALPASSAVATVEMGFCEPGTSTPAAVSGATSWPGVSNGALVSGAAHWGMSPSVSHWNNGNAATTLDTASSFAAISPAAASGRDTVKVEFSGSFTSLTASTNIDVMTFTSTADDQWCITNAESQADNTQCKYFCQASIDMDYLTIALAGAIPTQPPFSYPTSATVTNYAVTFCEDSGCACTTSQVDDMKMHPLATFTLASTDAINAPSDPRTFVASADSSATGSFAAAILQSSGGAANSNSQVTTSIDVITFLSSSLSLSAESDGTPGALCTSGSCALKQVGCSSSFQWASLYMTVVLKQGSSETESSDDVTAQATFTSDNPSAASVSSSSDSWTLKGASAASAVQVTGDFFGQTSATMDVDVLEEQLQITAMSLQPFPSFFRGRQASAASNGGTPAPVTTASPCPGGSTCYTESRLKPIVTLSDGTSYSFDAASTTRGVSVSEVISFANSGGACLTGSCTTSSAITIASDGTATLNGQSSETTALTATAVTGGSCSTSSVPQTVDVVANVDAATFDVDLGDSEEVVFPDLGTGGQTWSVPVYVDTGGDPLTIFDVTVSFTAAENSYSLVSCDKFDSSSCGDSFADFCWPGFNFFCNALPEGNGYRMTGQEASNTAIKGRVRVATVTIETVATADIGSTTIPTTMEVGGTIDVISTTTDGQNQVTAGVDIFAGRGLLTIGARRLGTARLPVASRGVSAGRSLSADCSHMQGLQLADTNEDGEVNALDSALQLEKYVFGTHANCELACDPTYNGASDLVDFNLLSDSIVTAMLLFDRQESGGSMVAVGGNVTAQVDAYFKCAGCKATAGCTQFVAAFAQTQLRILMATQQNSDMVDVASHGSYIESAAPGLVTAWMEHKGEGLFQWQGQKASQEMFEDETMCFNVHQLKVGKVWGWADGSANIDLTQVANGGIDCFLLTSNTVTETTGSWSTTSSITETDTTTAGQTNAPTTTSITTTFMYDFTMEVNFSASSDQSVVSEKIIEAVASNLGVAQEDIVLDLTGDSQNWMAVLNMPVPNPIVESIQSGAIVVSTATVRLALIQSGLTDAAVASVEYSYAEPICRDACGSWATLATLAGCPTQFALSGGADKEASLVAWEGGERTGAVAAKCVVTGTNGAMTASVSYVAMSRPALAPAKLRFSVYSPDLFFDSHTSDDRVLGPTLRVAYQVWDQHWRTEVSSWTPSGFQPTLSVTFGSTTLTQTCGAPDTSTGMGVCTYDLGSSFSTTSDISLEVTVTHDIISEYVLATGMSGASSPTAQAATMWRNPNVNQSSNAQTIAEGAVYLVLPTHPLFLSESFQVAVQANTGAKFFKQLDINLNWDQSIVSLSTIAVPAGSFGNNYQILASTYKADNGQGLLPSDEDTAVGACTGVCGWQGVLDRAPGGSLLAGNFHALTLSFVLLSPSSGSTTQVTDAVSADVNFFNYEESGLFLPFSFTTGNVPVVDVAGTTGGVLPTAGTIDIVYDQTAALFGAFDGQGVSGTMYNTAALDGQQVSKSLLVKRFTTFQSDSTTAPGATCEASPSTASTCTASGSAFQVQMDSSHTSGAFYATARASLDGAQVDVHFSALYPQLSSIYAEQDTLDNIAADGHCSAEYASTDVVVMMAFTASDDPAPAAPVDATQLVLSKLSVASGTEFVSLAAPSVTGVAPGSAQIQVTGFASSSATVTVRSAVATPTLTVLTLDATSASSSLEYTTGALPTAAEDASVSCTFDAEGQAGFVYTFASFPSGGVHLLPEQAVSLSTLSGSIDVLSSTKVEIAVGAGSLCDFGVSSKWLLSNTSDCSVGDVSGDSAVNITLPGVCGLEFTLSATSIALPGDFATLYPYNFGTSAQVTSVMVSFCSAGSNVVDYVTETASDNRTSISLSSAANVSFDGLVFTADANTGSAEVTVSFGASSASQTIQVVGHLAGSIPVPCQAVISLSSNEIAQASDYATSVPFSLPPSATIESVSVSFCASGTSTPEAVRGETEWEAVSGGQVVAEASHWGMQIGKSAGASVLSLTLADSQYTISPTTTSDRDFLTATFASEFTSLASVPTIVDVMSYDASTPGEWCITNGQSAGDANQQCKNICSAAVTTDETIIAFAGATPTLAPFNKPAQAAVTSLDIGFCAPSCDQCTTPESYDMKSDPRAQFSSTGVSYSRLVVTADSDAAATGTLAAQLENGSANSEDTISIHVIAYSSSRLRLAPQSSDSTENVCDTDCQLKLVGCSSKFQWGSIFMEVTLVYGTGADEGNMTLYTTAESGFQSSDTATLDVTGSVAKGVSPVVAAVVTGEYNGHTATLSVSVVSEYLTVTQLGLEPFPAFFRGRQSSSGAITTASPCPGGAEVSCVTSTRLLPTITLSDGTTYSFLDATETRGVSVSEVLTFADSGGACLAGSCTTDSAVTVDASGVATLNGQSAELTTLTAEVIQIEGTCATSSVPQTKDVVANIDAAQYDVDVGHSEQVVFPDQTEQVSWEVPVYIDSGDQFLAVFDVTIRVSADHFTMAACSSFEVTSCGDSYADFCWPGYEFFCGPLPLGNGYRMTGQKQDNAQIKGRIRVATISVTPQQLQGSVASAGPLDVNGLIDVLATTDSYPDSVLPAGTSIFAGQGLVSIVGAQRRLHNKPLPVLRDVPRAPRALSASSCTSLQGLSLADTNEDGNINALDTALVLEKYLKRPVAHPDCECDPTFNGIPDLNDYNLLSEAIVTNYVLFDRLESSVGVKSSADGLTETLDAHIYMKCAGCRPDEGCNEFKAAFAETTIKVLMNMQTNFDVVSMDTSGSSVDDTAPGLITTTAEHLGLGQFQVLVRPSGKSTFTPEAGACLAVHQYKTTYRWGWNDDSSAMSTDSVECTMDFDIVNVNLVSVTETQTTTSTFTDTTGSFSTTYATETFTTRTTFTTTATTGSFSTTITTQTTYTDTTTKTTTTVTTTTVTTGTSITTSTTTVVYAVQGAMSVTTTASQEDVQLAACKAIAALYNIPLSWITCDATPVSSRLLAALPGPSRSLSSQPVEYTIAYEIVPASSGDSWEQSATDILDNTQVTTDALQSQMVQDIPDLTVTNVEPAQVVPVTLTATETTASSTTTGTATTITGESVTATTTTVTTPTSITATTTTKSTDTVAFNVGTAAPTGTTDASEADTTAIIVGVLGGVAFLAAVGAATYFRKRLFPGGPTAARAPASSGSSDRQENVNVNEARAHDGNEPLPSHPGASSSGGQNAVLDLENPQNNQDKSLLEDPQHIKSPPSPSAFEVHPTTRPPEPLEEVRAESSSRPRLMPEAQLGRAPQLVGDAESLEEHVSHPAENDEPPVHPLSARSAEMVYRPRRDRTLASNTIAEESAV